MRRAAGGDVEHDRDAAGDARVGASPPAPLEAQRPDVDHQAVAVVGGPHLARARLALERRAEQRLERRSRARRGNAPPSGSPSLQALRAAEALERLPGGEHEAQLVVEREHERLGQLAQGGLRRQIGAAR